MDEAVFHVTLDSLLKQGQRFNKRLGHSPQQRHPYVEPSQRGRAAGGFLRGGGGRRIWFWVHKKLIIKREKPRLVATGFGNYGAFFLILFVDGRYGQISQQAHHEQARHRVKHALVGSGPGQTLLFGPIVQQVHN